MLQVAVLEGMVDTNVVLLLITTDGTAICKYYSCVAIVKDL